MLTIPILLKDVVEGDEDEDEEEEEEEETGAGVPMSGQPSFTQQAGNAPSSVPSLTSNYSARTSPISVGDPKPDKSLMIDLSVYALPQFARAAEGGKVKTVRQWAQRTEFGSTAWV